MAWSRRNGDVRLRRAEALKAAVVRVKITVQFYKRHSPTPAPCCPALASATSGSLSSLLVLRYRGFMGEPLESRG
jgi:hypothetical protein